MKKEFIFGPTQNHCLKYCEVHGLNPEEYVILDTKTPWHITARQFAEEVERTNVKVIDIEYEDAIPFNDIMNYLDITDALTMEIVDNVYFG